MINQLVELIGVGHGMVGKLKTMLLNPPPFHFYFKEYYDPYSLFLISRLEKCVILSHSTRLVRGLPVRERPPMCIGTKFNFAKDFFFLLGSKKGLY